MLRLLVCTLFTQENEFEECVKSIQIQNYRHFEHIVFENLPNKEAHDALYSSFFDNSAEFDLLVKVDADMVLTDRDFFGKLAEKFCTLPWLEHLEIAVHDFFSDQLIWGLHVYRNTFQWKKKEETLFTDLVPMDNKRKLSDADDLAPAAIHCKNPGRFQSFHYGIHKAVKIMQPDRKDKKPSYSKYHWDIIQKTWNHFLTTKDVRLGLSVLGAEFAFLNKLQPGHLDYTNPYCYDHFIEYENYDFGQIFQEINRFRNWNWGFLPDEMRRDVISYLEGGHMLHLRTLARLMIGLSMYMKRKCIGLISK